MNCFCTGQEVALLNLIWTLNLYLTGTIAEFWINMYDIERITKIIEDIERYFKDLDYLNIKSKEDLKDRKNFYSLSMILFSITNRTIDLGDEIVSANKLGMPSTYKDIFRLLCRNNIISRDLERKLSTLVFYRNLLSHEYYDLSEKDVFDVFIRISAVKEFLEIVKTLLRKNK
ncbi:MAG: hypothetical protein DRP10_03105 [Candidatus Aenigmatarchaeota archaeon]|nr:MAG: hypothetical protein DRP10_03105 [Candidatus Aenigmarchaeota archaeon]